ncbi:MAG: polyprenyl synthetase family protein [Deltaproteobacteria bacterium]|jgi:geranylgeranyl diphosphate synthase type II|nr:polyprenyl synthetase family protein [Deltaproteobacteria bacterium]
MNFKEHLKKQGALVENYLVNCLDRFDAIPGGPTGNLGLPAGLKKAMYYSLLAGGKRIRPVLCLSSAALFGLAEEYALPLAAGLECIHSYSLIHDDLPAMDNDDLRRGKPSSHKQFGEATAILAGDGLLTDAFYLMAETASSGRVAPANALRALAAVALAAGSSGMVGGQYLDMEYTARVDISLPELARMQAGKTGAMLAVSCSSGAMLAGAPAAAVAAIDEYGRWLGKAFQIVDDILDETGTEEELGKPVGSDAAQGKVTYPSLVGLAESRRLAEATGAEALAALGRAVAGLALRPERQAQVDFLAELIGYLLKRGS